MFDHAFKLRIANVQKVIEVPRSRIKSLDNISLIVMVKSIHQTLSVVVLFVLCLGVIFFVLLAPYVCFHIFS